MTSYGDSDYHSADGKLGGGGIANKTQNFEVVAQYQFDFGLRPSIAYLQSKGKDLGGQDMDSHGNYRYSRQRFWLNMLTSGMTYYFNKNICPPTFDYKINLLDEDDDFYANNGIATDDIVGVGSGLPVLRRFMLVKPVLSAGLLL
ncbi:outer membrane protein N [Salmonella enterica subsp. enterica]|nr:outer membrane protein N [Salmonella enterica subsp. enterica]